MGREKLRTVILIQPRVGFWEEYNPDPMTPLGPLRVASPIKDSFNVHIVDQRNNKNWEKELEDLLKKDVVCVGMTSMSGIQINFALKAAEVVRRQSNVPIVWGGVHPTLVPEQTLQHRLVDMIIIGEGEYSFKALVEELQKGKMPHGIKGVWYKENKRIVKNPEREFCNMENLPYIPLDLIDTEKYMKKGRELYMETSRGCPYQCGYCYNKVFNKGKFRKQSAAKVLQEIDHYVKAYGIKKIFFVDDEFFLDLRRVEAIVDGLLERGYDLSWECQGIRVDSIIKMKDTLIRKIVNSGCTKFLIGIETGSKRMLNYIKKGITVDQIHHANRRMANYPIHLRYNFMCGFPNETIQDLKESAQLMVKLIEDNPRAKIAFMSIYKPYPGTFLYREAKKLGFKEPRSLPEWGEKFNWEKSTSDWIPPKRKELLEAMHIVAYGLRVNKSMDSVPLPLRIIGRLYRRIAVVRFKHFFFGLLFEKKVKELLLRE